jgi:hypothetical protein
MLRPVRVDRRKQLLTDKHLGCAQRIKMQALPAPVQSTVWTIHITVNVSAAMLYCEHDG